MSDLPAPSSPSWDRPDVADSVTAPVETADGAPATGQVATEPTSIVRPLPTLAPMVRQVGQLTVPWQIVCATAWAAAFFAFAGVWKASEEIGIGTWWLGPRADPQPIVIRIIPFAICVLMSLAAIYNVKRYPWISLGGTAAIALVAALDISRSGGLAIAQFAIAGALLLVSLASFGGRYVAGTESDDEPAYDPGTPIDTPPATGTDVPV